MFGYIQVFYFLFLNGAIIFAIYNILIYNKKKLDNYADSAIYCINVLILFQAIYNLICRMAWSELGFLNIGTPIKLLYGPLFLYVVRSTIYKRPLFNLRKIGLYLHFIPFLFFLFWFVELVRHQGDFGYEQKDNFYLRVLYIVSGAQIMVYSIISLYIMQVYDLVKKNKRVKRLFFDGLLILIIRGIYLIGDALNKDFNLKENDLASLFSYLLMFIIILLIHNVWIKNYFVNPTKDPALMIDRRELEKAKDVLGSGKSKQAKYNKSRVDHQDLSDYAKRLDRIDMDVFLDRDLNMEKLASILHVNVHTVSQVFSLVLETSYSGYVHKKRISHCIELLQKHPNLSIHELSEECGFNSLASFYRAFKDIYGMTPREYQKKITKHE
ncbi:helix-turn-helix domain-containing protein [Myroides sp. LJL110]